MVTQGTPGMYDSLPYRNDAATVFRRQIRSLPTLVEGGRLTAAMASQLSDASAAMLMPDVVAP